MTVTLQAKRTIYEARHYVIFSSLCYLISLKSVRLFLLLRFSFKVSHCFSQPHKPTCKISEQSSRGGNGSELHLGGTRFEPWP